MSFNTNLSPEQAARIRQALAIAVAQFRTEYPRAKMSDAIKEQLLVAMLDMAIGTDSSPEDLADYAVHTMKPKTIQ